MGAVYPVASPGNGSDMRCTYGPYHGSDPKGHLYFEDTPPGGAATITLLPAACASQAWINKRGELIARALRELDSNTYTVVGTYADGDQQRFAEDFDAADADEAEALAEVWADDQDAVIHIAAVLRGCQVVA